VNLIREAMVAETDKLTGNKEEAVMKRELYKLACAADVVLDLHCDTEAVLHIYTHDRLWPRMADLAAELGSHCQLLASTSGGNPFDEVCSHPWAALADKFPGFNIPMACESVTVELRGERDVFDHFAITDAEGILRFLRGRGYVAPGSNPTPTPALIRDATPLTGVDMIEASKAGVIAWRVKHGDYVEEDTILGEIVDIEDPDAPRVPITSKTAGLVFGVRSHKLAKPGHIIIKVSGEKPLGWRTGNLLTSR
jgi:uncharacterized protein